MSGISLSGLFSGLDTNTMITQLMQIERINYNKLESRKTDYTTQQSMFRSINAQLNLLKGAAFDLTLRANYQLTTAKSSDETVVKVSSTDGAVTGQYNIEVGQLAQSHSIASGALTANANSTLIGQKIKIEYDGKSKEFELTGSEDDNTNQYVLNDLKNQINSARLGVKASVVRTDDNEIKLVLTSDKTGEDYRMVNGSPTGKNIGITNVGTDTALQDLGLFTGGGAVVTELQAAQDAEFLVNNLAVRSSSNEVTDVIQNATITLLKGDNSKATVNVSTDADKVAEKVEAFVKAYNDTIDLIRKTKSWQNSSKQKPLNGDSTLRGLESQLHSWLNSQVGTSQAHQYLFAIGIEVDKGKTNGVDMNGKISFDKEKFKQAFLKDPEAVFDVFAFKDESANAAHGIARLFNDSLLNWTSSVDGIIYAKLNGFDDQISFLSDQMEQMDTRLRLREESLRKQFTAMEAALSELQSQQNWLGSQLATW